MGEAQARAGMRPIRHAVPIGAGSEFVVSAAAAVAVLRDAAPADEGAGAAQERIRRALAVASAAGEQVRAGTGPGGRPWECDVVEDVGDLARRAGLETEAAARALDELARDGVVHRLRPGGEARFQLPESLFVRRPVAARVDWELLRSTLVEEGLAGSVLAAQAVVRELSGRTAARDADGRGEWLACTLGALASATFFQRARVAAALRLLERFGFAEIGRRNGRNARYRLLPPAFGEAQPRRGSREHAAPARDAGVALVARLGGVEIRLRAGARLEVPPGWEAVVVAGAADVPTVELRELT